VEQEEQQFSARKGRIRRAISHALASIWEKDPPVQEIGLGHTRAWPKGRRSVPGLFTSSLLHFSVVLLLVRLPIALLLGRPNSGGNRTERVVYMLHPLTFPGFFPTLKPPGPGGKPGQGSRPDRPPVRGSTVFHSSLTIVSNPPRPDNSRQTILQPSSPPHLKIPYEIRLPNILIGALTPPPPERRLPMPPAPAPKPIERPIVVPTRAPTPTPPAPAPALALVNPTNPLPNPALAVAVPPPPTPPPQPSESSEAKALDELDMRKNPNGTTGLLSLSVEPAVSAGTVALPPGNREGAFSISPAGGKEGSPGGVPNGDALGGGTGGKGPAGDASTGLGSGDKGGGGGKGAAGEASTTGTPGPSDNVSISGSPTSNSNDVLSAFFAATTVFPVAPSPPRRPMMVVTTGPVGGGGLEVYRVLKGGKIYTIYLPMPGKNWILQYCAHDIQAGNQSQQHPSVEIKLDSPIVPPAALEQFDFHRPPVAETGACRKEMIILQGVIREDGSVGDLKVYKGLIGAADQAALTAFSRWKFRPAQRSNKPIAVEILVGIPVLLPTT